MDVIIILAAKYLFLVVILIAALVAARFDTVTRKRLLNLSLITFPLGYFLTKLLGYFIYNPRPFVTDHITPLIKHTADNGFPSDHTVLTMTIAAVFFVYNRKIGILLFALAAGVGISRILAGLHHPVDILGSSAIATVATAVGWYITKHIKWFSS